MAFTKFPGPKPVDVDAMKAELASVLQDGGLLSEEPAADEPADDVADEVVADESSDEGGDEAPLSEDDVFAQLNDIEKAAWANGWRPEDVYAGDPGKWVDAKTFMDRQPLFDKIGQQNKLIKNQAGKISALEKAIKTLTALQKTSALKTIEEQKAAIKARQQEAFEDRDHAAYEANSKRLAELESQDAALADLDFNLEAEGEESATPEPAELPPVYNEFLARNKSWFNVDPRATAVANDESLRVYNATKGSHDQKLEAAIKAAEKAVQESFPKLFANPKRRQAAAVGGNKNGATGPQVDARSKVRAKQGMNKLEREIMARVIEDTGMSEDDYLKQYMK